MRRIMVGVLSRVDGAEQIRLKGLPRTMGLEFQLARQAVGQLKRRVVDLLQGCARSVSNKMEFVEGRRFAGNEIEDETQALCAAPCWVQLPGRCLAGYVSVLSFHSLAK